MGVTAVFHQFLVYDKANCSLSAILLFDDHFSPIYNPRLGSVRNMLINMLICSGCTCSIFYLIFEGRDDCCEKSAPASFELISDWEENHVKKNNC